MSVSVILIKRQGFRKQSARAAHDRLSFPLALAGLAGVWRMGEVEIHIVDYDKIQKSITVEIAERATCTPARFWRKQAPLPGLVLERAIAEISIENVPSPLGDEQVRISMIVYVSNADSLSPPGGLDSRFVGDVFEFQSTQIVVKEMLRLDGACPECP